MKKIFAFLLTVSPLTAAAQFQSFPAGESVPENAICYALPATRIDMTVTVRTIVEEPGEFARYAERYLGEKDIITASSVKKELVKVEVCTYPVADANHRYFLVSGTLNSKISPILPAVYLSQEGILQGINTAPTCTVPKPCLHPSQTPCCRPESTPVYPMTSEMLQASSSVKMAELAAKQVFALRDTRLALLQGELENMPKDGEGIRLFLEEMSRTEQAYMELFTGSRHATCETVLVSFIPQNIGGNETAFRFSSQKGVVDISDLSGSPVILTVIPVEEGKVSQQIDAVPNPDRKSSVTSLEVPAGVYYYIPRLCKVEIAFNQQTLFQQVLEIAQAGQLMKLPAEPNLQAEFSPVNGTLIGRSINTPAK